MTHQCEFVRRASFQRRIEREALLDDVLSHAEACSFSTCSSSATEVAPEAACNEDQTAEFHRTSISKLSLTFQMRQSTPLRDILAASAAPPLPLPIADISKRISKNNEDNIEVALDEYVLQSSISKLRSIFQSSSLRDIFAAASTAPPPLPRPIHR
jgi:hypothetical protein